MGKKLMNEQIQSQSRTPRGYRFNEMSQKTGIYCQLLSIDDQCLLTIILGIK